MIKKTNHIDDGRTHWESCYLDHMDCAYEKIIDLEEKNKYLNKVLEERHAERHKNWEIITQLQQENKKLKAEVQHLMECLNEGRK